MNSTELQIPIPTKEPYAREAMGSVSAAARAAVVNRTHRVIRERAMVMQQKRSRDRSLLIPLLLCSVLLLLSVLAVWTGLYQYNDVADAMQPEINAIADLNNHFLVVMLWFVPVSFAVMAAVWVRRSRNNDEAR